MPQLREIVLTSAIPEEPGSDFLRPNKHSHRELLGEFDKIAKEPMIKGLFLRLGPTSGAWARVGELRSALQRIRAAQKPVHCHFDNLDNVGYALLASSCDRLSMGPAGMLMLTGVQTEVVYAKDLLRLIGLQAELLQIGRFKGAADALTRSDMPGEVREVLNNLVDDLQTTLSGAVTSGRKIDAAAFQAAVDSGPHPARTALERKLIDAITFDDEARSTAKSAAKAERVVRALRDDESQHVDLSAVVKALFGGKPEPAKGERVVLAYLTGTITDDERDRGDGAPSGPFVAAMRRFADDKDVKAVVLRIQSPGGSALASDKMWHAVRRVAQRKPLIVSIGDMAASGGYYVACGGTQIFADDDSIVGSIGVVGGKIVAQSLADRVGIHTAALRRGQNAGWMSPFHAFTDSERRALQLAMQETYDTFLARVSEGRNLNQERLSAVVEGRIMSGKRAREGGLVDTIGGLQDALAEARSKGGVRDDTKLEVWPKERSVLERASHLMGADSEARGIQELLPELVRAPIVAAWLRGEVTPLAALPYVLKVE